jgi:hypothetical protein
VPGWIDEKNQPRLQKPSKLPQVVKHIQQISCTFGTQFNGKEDKGIVWTKVTSPDLDHRFRTGDAVLKTWVAGDSLELKSRPQASPDLSSRNFHCGTDRGPWRDEFRRA